jgi:hypothetical protein
MKTLTAICLTLLLLICALFPQAADAFDGERKGFFLSLGVGSGFVEAESLNFGWEEDGSSFSTAFRLGQVVLSDWSSSGR